jgi:TfoX/Sxy family transcriptional regulator of competence genes
MGRAKSKVKNQKAKTKSKNARPKASVIKRVMPHFGKSPEALVLRFENALRDFPASQQRKMFGFPAAFINGNMFASLFNDKMILRLSSADAGKLGNTKQFEPVAGRAMTGWFVVPPRILNSPRELNVWMEKAFEYTKAMPAKRK